MYVRLPYPRHFGTFGTTSIPDTLVSSVLPLENTLVPGTTLLNYYYPRSGTGTSSRTIPITPGKLGKTSIPVPDALVSSVGPRQHTLVPGTALLKYPGYGYGYPWYPGMALFIPLGNGHNQRDC